MANPPTKRRGISLDPRVDTAVSPDLLSAQPTSSHPTRREQSHAAGEAPGHESGGVPTAVTEQIAALRRANAHLQLRARRQSEQLHRQLALLEQQHDQIALQTRQLQALEHSRKASGRISFLSALLVIVGIGALGFHHWPEIQDITAKWNRISAGEDQLAPKLQAVRGQLAALGTDLDRMGGAITSLREDVSGVRAELGAIRKDISATASTAQGVPSNATTMSNPYRGLRPRMPW